VPGPDPQAVWIEEDADGRPLVTQEVALIAGRTARKRRSLRLPRNVMRRRWPRRRCREPVPHFRRTDARFCGGSCRKTAAGSLRQWLDGRAQPKRSCALRQQNGVDSPAAHCVLTVRLAADPRPKSAERSGALPQLWTSQIVSNMETASALARSQLERTRTRDTDR
jgi:hypothetical protein